MIRPGAPPQESRTKRLWRRRFRRWRNLGWAGWVVVARRAAPWALLVFVVVQVKTLSERVRQVEETEFSKVQHEVDLLRSALARLRDSAAEADKELASATDSLKAVNQSLAVARRGAPQLSKNIVDATAACESVKHELPDTEQTTVLTQAVKNIGEQLDQTTARLSDVQSKVPEPARWTALNTSLDAHQKRVDAMGALLPKPEQLGALTRQLDASTAALAELRAGLPSAEQVDALKKALANAREALSRVDQGTASTQAVRGGSAQ